MRILDSKVGTGKRKTPNEISSPQSPGPHRGLDGDRVLFQAFPAADNSGVKKRCLRWAMAGEGQCCGAMLRAWAANSICPGVRPGPRPRWLRPAVVC